MTISTACEPNKLVWIFDPWMFFHNEAFPSYLSQKKSPINSFSACFVISILNNISIKSWCIPYSIHSLSYHAMTHTNWYLFRFFPGGIYQPIISKKQHPCVFFQFQENINRFSYIWALLRWWWCSFRCSLDHLSEHITDCTLDCTVYSRLYGTYYLDKVWYDSSYID